MAEISVQFYCPVCDVPVYEACRTPAGTERISHARRILLAVAERLVQFACGGEHRAAHAVVSAITLAQMLTIGRDDVEEADPQRADFAEKLTLVNALDLEQLIADALTARNGRSLELGGAIDKVKALKADLEVAHVMTHARQRGLQRPADADPDWPDPPTPEQARIWEELHHNQRLRGRAACRDRAADATTPREPGPAMRWDIRDYLANGTYVAHHAGTGVDDSEGAQQVHGWAPVPEAVPDMLRQWSIPPDRPLAIDWHVDPPRPTRCLPEDGYRPGHPGNHPDITEHAGIDVQLAWESQPDRDLAAFTQAASQFAGRWPKIRVEEVLTEAARRLNAGEPLAPHLGQLVFGGCGDRNETSCLGTTVTTGWIDPAKVAAASAGGDSWNNFADHRPDTAPMLTKALLDGDLGTALEVWNFVRDPFDVTRVPGPAGPLYERGSNGTHRIHTARMIGLPLLWVEIRQYTLPLRIRVHELFATRDRAPSPAETRDVIDCWRGLLERGLLHGGPEEDADFPGLSTLYPDWAAAPWLLAEPGDATRWAANYERAYPGALPACGIPTNAWQTPQSWHDWLTSA